MSKLVGAMRKIEISGGRGIGDDCPCFVIAEAGVNHNGSIDMALNNTQPGSVSVSVTRFAVLPSGAGAAFESTVHLEA